MLFLRRKARAQEAQEHEEVEQRLVHQERELAQMARRVRLLEIEAGIYRPLREIK